MTNICEERERNEAPSDESNEDHDVWRVRRGLKSCKFMAKIYYRAVRLFGNGRFRTVAQDWCKVKCAKDHGTPRL